MYRYRYTYQHHVQTLHVLTKTFKWHVCLVVCLGHNILLLHSLGQQYGEIFSFLTLYCPFGRANTATLELIISPYFPPSHAIMIYICPTTGSNDHWGCRALISEKRSPAALRGLISGMVHPTVVLGQIDSMQVKEYHESSLAPEIENDSNMSAKFLIPIH